MLVLLYKKDTFESGVNETHAVLVFLVFYYKQIPSMVDVPEKMISKPMTNLSRNK